jgi:hypothetical protein
MQEWTDLDPGFGSMDDLFDYRSRLSTVSARAEFAADEIDKCFSLLQEEMEGTAAEAAFPVFERDGKLQRRISAASAQVASAISVYADEVALIASAAAVPIADHLDALRRLEVTYMDSSTNPPSDAELKRRSREWDSARADRNSAVSALQALATRRHNADSLLIAAVGEAISSNWSAYDHAPLDNSAYRRAANDEVWELFAEFRDGVGNHRLLLDDDPFVKMLMTSGHVNVVRDAIRRDIESGALVEGDGAYAGRSLGENPWVFLGDGINIGTGGANGNLPESFLGSYNLRYSVVEIAGGEAIVTFTAQNDTTIESFSRNPVFPGQVEPFYGDLVRMQAEGLYQDTSQTIVWTERIPLS